MEFKHYDVNPCGEGIEAVAEIFIVEGFNIRDKAPPSRELLTSAESSSMPPDIKEMVLEELHW